MNFKFIFFDFGGVLANGTNTVMLENILGKTHPNFTSISEILRKHNYEWKSGLISEDHFWELFCNDSTILKDLKISNISEGKKFLKCEIRKTFKIYQPVLELVQKIKKISNCKIGILSNHTIEIFWEYFNYFKLEKIFDEKELIIVSAEVKCYKPNKEIYEVLYKRVKKKYGNVDRKNIIIIDDKQKNIDVAKECGMINGIVFNYYRKDKISDLVESLRKLGVEISTK